MATLTVHVYDSDDNPWDGADVFISIDEGIIPDYHDEGNTDSNGVVEFNVPDYCEVEIHVNGNIETTIGMGGRDQDITINL